jgi:phosphoglycolate phosphatase
MTSWRVRAATCAAIIDLDGTLVDTLGDFDLALNAALRLHALPPAAPEAIVNWVGKGSENLVHSALVALGADAALTPLVLKTYLEQYVHINGQRARVFDGVLPALQGLRALGWRLACVTNKPEAPARDLLAKTGLAPYFELVVGGDSLPRRKPDPLPITHSCATMGLTAAQVLVMGDSVNDAQAARAAGCDVVLMTHGYNHGQDVSELVAQGLADAALDRMDALLTRLAPLR